MLTVLLSVVVVAGLPQEPPPAAAPVTLEETVATVLAKSPLRQAADASASGARTAAEAAGAWPNPVAEVRAENWMFDGWPWTPGLDPGAPPAIDFFALLSQPLPVGGKRSARRGIALADQAAADAALAQTERTLSREAIRLYLDALRARELLAALAENNDGLATLQRAMAARVREGTAAQADLAKFRAESARVQTQILRTRIELDRSLALINALAGNWTLTAGRLMMPADAGPPGGDPDTLAARVVDGSPDVLAARAHEARASQTLSLESAQRMPDPTVVGGYKRTAGADTAVVGLTVSLPLFDRNRQAVALATGGARAALRVREATEARVRAEAHALIDAARLLHDRSRLIDDEVLAPADTVRRAARSAFREGASDILNLVDAERVYLEARREALELKLDATAATLELRLALGERIVP